MKSTTASIIISVALIIAAIILTRATPVPEQKNETNVHVIDGKQIIEIQAKGGYSPRRSIATAGIPTILRFNTNGTFDCSAFVNIPGAGINQVLNQSGTTDIDIGVPREGTMPGTCSMGMYPFEVVFQNQTSTSSETQSKATLKG